MFSLRVRTHAKRERDRASPQAHLRAIVLAFAAFGVAACANTGASRAPNAGIVVNQESPTQTALRNILAAKSGIESTQAKQLLSFYQQRNFKPAWTGSAQEQELAANVRAVLARADDQGLRSEDYKLPRDDSQAMAGSKAAEYDLVLTDAVLRYSHDVRTGRVQPKSVYDDVGLPASRFDAAADLNRALENRSLAQFLAELPPPHPEYRRLADALAHYRSIAVEGGWPGLPDAKEIKLGTNDPGQGLLIKRLIFEDPILAAISTPSTTQLRDAVKRFQARNGFEEDGRVMSETLTALNVPASARVAQIAANMERWRWLPAPFERRYVAVNVPDQSLAFVRDGTIALTSRVIIGRKTSPTPIARTEIKAIVANPPWNIPGDIAARDLLPHLRQNPNYLASKNMVVMDGPPGDPHGRTIDWRKIVPAEFPYAIRQLAGPTTALGALMLDSPNDFDVYLHDTPNKKRFEAAERDISNGCVRVQQIFPLASLALTDDAAQGMDTLKKATTTHETQRLALETPLPVYFLYWTAVPGPDGQMGFRPDRYGRDATLIAALTKAEQRPPAAAGKPANAAESSASEADELSP